ncbi:MAG: hypothetical protein KAG96_05455 [Ichthyobacteriaceae bacterium]|nr:hypothetical protein [Ichthyobacteriaceae bacterium]
MFKNIYLSRLRHEEHVQFMTEVVKTGKELYTTGNQIEPYIKAMEPYITNISNLLNKRANVESSIDLENVDLRRYEAYVGLKLLVEGYTNHFDEIKRKSAEVLMSYFKNKGGCLRKLNYHEQTTYINNLLNDLETDKLVLEAINSLNLAVWFNELKIANTTFEDIYMYSIDRNDTNNAEAIKNLRLKLNLLYSKLNYGVFALSVVNVSTNYSEFIISVNDIVTFYDNKIKVRRANSVVKEFELAAIF